MTIEVIDMRGSALGRLHHRICAVESSRCPRWTADRDHRGTEGSGYRGRLPGLTGAAVLCHAARRGGAAALDDRMAAWQSTAATT